MNRFLASLDKSRFQEVVTEVSTAIKYEEAHQKRRTAIAAVPEAAALLPNEESKASLEEAMSLCIVVETRDGSPKSSTTTEKTLVIKGKRQKVRFTSGSMMCSFCGMTYHILENCRKMEEAKRDLQNKKPPSSGGGGGQRGRGGGRSISGQRGGGRGGRGGRRGFPRILKKPAMPVSRQGTPGLAQKARKAMSLQDE